MYVLGVQGGVQSASMAVCWRVAEQGSGASEGETLQGALEGGGFGLGGISVANGMRAGMTT